MVIQQQQPPQQKPKLVIARGVVGVGKGKADKERKSYRRPVVE